MTLSTVEIELNPSSLTVLGQSRDKKVNHFDNSIQLSQLKETVELAQKEIEGPSFCCKNNFILTHQEN